MQSIVNIQSVIVHKSESYGDWFGFTGEPGNSAEWDLRFNVAGQSQAQRFDNTRDGSVLSVNRQFLVDLSQIENLNVQVSGWEIDDTSANDPLPLATYTIVPKDNWQEGQTFRFSAASHQDFSYEVVFDIRAAESIGTSSSALTEATPLLLGSAMSLGPDQLDVFTTGPNGGAYVASWDQHVAEATWRGWTILNQVAQFASPVTAVSRCDKCIDVFALDKSGRIYTAAKVPETDGKWAGWWGVLGGVAAPNTSVSAVSRAANFLDIFAVGKDGKIYTAAWCPDFADGWHGWWRIGDAVAAPNTSVSAVSRAPNKLDVFIVGQDGGIWTAAWDADVDEGRWRGWWRVL